MDSRNMHIICQAKLYKASWVKRAASESEYEYIGVGDDFEIDAAKKIIESTFKEDTVLLVNGRNTSKEIATKSAHEDIKILTKNNEVTLTNKTFSAFIRFNIVGSYRIGHLPPHQFNQRGR